MDATVSNATTTRLLESLHDSGNEAAWSELDSRYRPIIFGVARRIGLGEEDAADVAQQTLIEFFRDYRSGKYDRERGRLRMWIAGIARHRSLDLLRSEVRRRGFRGESGYLQLPAEKQLSELWNGEREQLILRRAMDELRENSGTTENTLQVFERVALEGLPPDRVARERQLSVDEVYRIKHRITRRLREITARLRALYQEEE